MATTATAARPTVKEYTFQWVGLDRNRREVRGESRAVSETVVTTNLRRQGIRVTKIRRQTLRGGRSISQKDITFFTRQLATMLKAGVPMLAIVGDADGIIPPARSRSLFDAWAGPKTWVVVPGAGHNDLGSTPDVWAPMATFVEGLPSRP